MRLAGESPDDGSELIQSVCAELVHVLEDGHGWPVVSQDTPAQGVVLAESDRAKADSLKSEGERARAAEEIEDIHDFR